MLTQFTRGRWVNTNESFDNALPQVFVMSLMVITRHVQVDELDLSDQLIDPSGSGNDFKSVSC